MTPGPGREGGPLRVVRLDGGGPAPVARFGEDPPDEATARDIAEPASLFDRLVAPAAGPVASVQSLESPGRGAPDPDAGDPDAGDPDAEDRGAGDRGAGGAPVAGLSDIGGGPAPASRTAELTGLVPGRRGGGRAAPSPSGGRPARRRATPRDVEPAPSHPGRYEPGTATTDHDPAEPTSDDATEKPRRGGRSGSRRGGGGFGGGRGAPAELDPDADPIAVAREVCLRLLADRARTRQELAQALRRKGVPDDAAHTVLERFDEVGLIDDAAFAGQWVRSRHNNRGLARRAIAMELRRKGVDDEVAGEALEEVDQESEERRARELVDRKLRTVPADTPEQRKKAATRLVGMLARKGYGGGIAYRVVREALAAHGAEIDELGTEPLD